MRTEAETGITLPGAKDCGGPQNLEEASKFLPRVFGAGMASLFGASRCQNRENQMLLF